VNREISSRRREKTMEDTMKTLLTVKSLVLSICLLGPSLLLPTNAVAQSVYDQAYTSGAVTPVVPKFSVAQLNGSSIYHFSVTVSSSSVPVDISIDEPLRERIMANGFRGLLGDSAVVLYTAELLARNLPQSSFPSHFSQPIVVRMNSVDQPSDSCLAIRICIYFFGYEYCLLDWSHCF